MIIAWGLRAGWLAVLTCGLMVPAEEAGRVRDADMPGLAAPVRLVGAWQRHGRHRSNHRKTRGCGGQGLRTRGLRVRCSGILFI